VCATAGGASGEGGLLGKGRHGAAGGARSFALCSACCVHQEEEENSREEGEEKREKRKEEGKEKMKKRKNEKFFKLENF
jgi:hypothetical protein